MNLPFFVYLPSLVAYISLTDIVIIDVNDNALFMSNGKVIRNIPIDEINLILNKYEGLHRIGVL